MHQDGSVLTIKRNDIVAVAYQNTYYLGIATELLDEEVEVTFLKKATRSLYKMDKDPEVETINPLFIFAKPTFIRSEKNIELSDSDLVKSLYKTYKS